MNTGLVLVSHSRALAEATERLVRQMAGPEVRIARAAGSGPDGEELGTDALAALAALESLADCDAVVVLVDIGSALLSAQLARDMAEEPLRARVHVSGAPFVEGALAAGVAARLGRPVAQVIAEAEAGLAPKQADLPPAPAPAPEQPAEIRRAARIADPQGLHLRPAAACAARAARFDARVTLRAGGRSADAASLTALLALGVRGGESVAIEAAGPEAAAAADALAALLAEAPAAPAPAAPLTARANAGPIPLSPGRVAGPLVEVHRPLPAIDRASRLPADEAARAAALTRLDQAIARVRREAGAEAIGRAQAGLLADPAITEPARRAIREDGLLPAAAWQAAVSAAAARLAGLADPYLRERARDITEIGQAVLRALAGSPPPAWPAAPAIVLIDGLTASEAASLPASVTGVLDRQGSPASHAAILLRAAGIPALGGVVLAPPPARVAFDGASGALIAEPDAETEAAFTPASAPRPRPASLPFRGGTVEFWANVAGPADAAAAARAGAFGIGLARTEMLFLEREEAPPIEEQAARIGAMLAPFRGRPVVVRLLDAGTDKPAPFLKLAPEENPALGVRGVRALLRAPAFLRAHLAAVLRAGAGHDLRIMVPMIAMPGEMVAVREMLGAACAAERCPAPPLGAMVEVPVTALRLAGFVPVSDFFSIGTNDLTQYVMAADRGEAALAELTRAGAPAVLELCAAVQAQAAGRPVSVCGEAAGEPDFALALARAGVRRLSMGAGRLDAVRAAFADEA